CKAGAEKQSSIPYREQKYGDPRRPQSEIRPGSQLRPTFGRICLVGPHADSDGIVRPIPAARCRSAASQTAWPGRDHARDLSRFELRRATQTRFREVRTGQAPLYAGRMPAVAIDI